MQSVNGKCPTTADMLITIRDNIVTSEYCLETIGCMTGKLQADFYSLTQELEYIINFLLNKRDEKSLTDMKRQRKQIIKEIQNLENEIIDLFEKVKEEKKWL